MERPNPDDILARVKAEEGTPRGKLKIFFGAVAGVGKTYTMLEAARQRKKEGVDIVVGYAETHKRAETEALLQGLEILPRKTVQYKNVSLPEFDIDAALKRKPAIILVDEMAHTNAPGSRHLKRWQDIEELLDKGINVYTTLNVQHCESANDVVAQVTGVVVRETVPDTCVERADEIELVDLPSEELLKRLKEGKVYLGQQAERAAQHFFQPGNLIALRQLALRYTERSVGSKMQAYRQAHSISKVWSVRDRFLVCVSPSPGAIRLIRAGKRIASDLGVEWVVAYVETPAQLRQVDRDRVLEMMRFAEKLGAEVVTLNGQDVAETLIAYAHAKNITKIIVGKPGKPRWHEILFGSLIDKLARTCGDIDLYLLSGETPEQGVPFTPTLISPFSWKNFGWTIGVVILCTVIDRLLFPYLALVNLVMIYFLGVTWIAFRYGRRMSIMAAALSVVLFDFFSVPPYHSFAVANIQYVITFAVMLVVGFTIAHLTGQLRQQTNAMRRREEQTDALYAQSRDLSKSSYPDELFQIALRHVQSFFKCQAVIFTPDLHNKLTVHFGRSKELGLSATEDAVAQWVYEHKKSAGKGTDTLPGSLGLYVPFVGVEKTVGVIGVFPHDEKQFMDPEQFHMLEMFVSQTALAVEGAQLAAAAIDAESKIANERLRNLLITTFSYEFPAPLKTISEISTELLQPETVQDASRRAELMEKMRHEIEFLHSLVNEINKVISSENISE